MQGKSRLGMLASLAAAAMLVNPGAMVVAGNGAHEVRTIQGETNPGARVVNPSAIRREEEFEEFLSGGLLDDGLRRYKLPAPFGLPRHRRPGERAHRRWRKARASGRKGAFRG